MNSFLFLIRFSVSLKSLNNYFFRRFAYRSLLNRFSVLINYIIWSSNHCSTPSCFPRFSGSRFLRVQLFQDPGFLGSGSRIWIQVLEVAQPGVAYKSIAHKKACNISVILLVLNDLTNICREISKTRMNLWMSFTCYVKGHGMRKLKRWVEGNCTLNPWPRSSEMGDCSRPFQ